MALTLGWSDWYSIHLQPIADNPTFLMEIIIATYYSSTSPSMENTSTRHTFRIPVTLDLVFQQMVLQFSRIRNRLLGHSSSSSTTFLPINNSSSRTSSHLESFLVQTSQRNLIHSCGHSPRRCFGLHVVRRPLMVAQ